MMLPSSPATDWAFRGWIGDVDSTENPLTIMVDAPMSVVAEFVEVGAAAGLDLVADLGALLVATGDLVAASDVTNLGFDRGGAAAAMGNGLPDVAEFMLLEALLESATYNRVPYGGTGHRTVYDAWAANLAQAELDLASSAPAIQRAIAGYMTLGTDGHTVWAVAAALEVASVTLDPANYTGARGLGEQDNADGDRAWNRLEWVSVLEEYQVTTPTMTEAALYVVWALDPSLPADEDVDIGLDIPDGDGTDWDYSYLPQGTVTFQSAPDLPIEIRILDPPGREDVPVPVGVPVDIPLGAELLVTLAEGANPDWFYTWSAPGNMIDGSAESTETFRLMRSGTIQPSRRAYKTVELPISPSGEGAFTVKWKGVGPYGHLVEENLSTGGVDVPVGAFLQLSAYRSKPAPSGGAGTSTAGSDTLPAKRWKYYYGHGPASEDIAYCYGNNPKFNTDVADGMFPEFYASTPYGLWTHIVESDGGGYVFIGDEEGSTPHDHGGLWNTVNTPAPAPGDTSNAKIKKAYSELPGFKFHHWEDGGGDKSISAPKSYCAVFVDELRLEVDVKVEGGGDTLTAAGHATADEARRWYSPINEEFVQLTASPNFRFDFVKWTGDGVAYPEALFGGPALGSPMALDNPDVPVKDATIWIGIGPDTGDRAVVATFAPWKALDIFGGGLPQSSAGAGAALSAIGYQVDPMATPCKSDVLDALPLYRVLNVFAHGNEQTCNGMAIHCCDSNGDPIEGLRSYEITPPITQYLLVYLSSCCQAGGNAAGGCSDTCAQTSEHWQLALNSQSFVGWVGSPTVYLGESQFGADFWQYLANDPTHDVAQAYQRAANDNQALFSQYIFPVLHGNAQL